jgi:hypothetical protein
MNLPMIGEGADQAPFGGQKRVAVLPDVLLPAPP